MKEKVVPKFHPFFSKERYKTSMNWQKNETCLFLKFKEPCGSYLALFDLDNTLIHTKSGKSWSSKIDDWKLKPNVETKLKEVERDGGLIAIITNQLDTKNNPSSQLKEKIGNVVKRIDMPLYVLMSTQYDYFRKPCPGMFMLLLDLVGPTKDFSKSYFVGDAAGRSDDFSDTDLKWALNNNLKFLVPEQFFEELKEAPEMTLSYRPKEMFVSEKNIEVIEEQEVVIFVGSPASGKSYYSKSIFSLYYHVNQDILGTRAKCLEQCVSKLEEGYSVVIDNTNPLIELRREYIELANKCGAKVRIVHFQFPRKYSEHLDMYRSITQGKRKLPKIAFNTYHSKLEVPTSNEAELIVLDKLYCPNPDAKLVKFLV
eukprot:NODE_14_length_51535_cov_1.125049.p16 type:complete len:370 gc:universal NODE_14_length_51535_cov_1.125049:8003-6894(-)